MIAAADFSTSVGTRRTRSNNNKTHKDAAALGRGSHFAPAPTVFPMYSARRPVLRAG
jgi:hypothetical protein